MFKNGKMQYVIKTCSSENTQELQNLLNEMSLSGWELYTMNEVETENGFVYNCIFMTELKPSEESSSSIVNVASFRNRMEKMLSPKLNPYEKCVEVQSKIISRQEEINRIKSQIEKEPPTSVTRKRLNDKMSAGLKELETLRKDLRESLSPDLMFSRLKGEKLEILLSEELLPFVDESADFSGEALIPETVKVRLKLTDEIGYVLPKIVFKDDETLNACEFMIKIRGVCVCRECVYPNYTMFYADDLHLEKKPKNAITGVDTASGRKVIWLEKSQTEDFWQKGMKPTEYIASLVEFFALKHAGDLVDYSDIEKYVDIVSDTNPTLVENLIPEVISISELKFILVKLIKEKVSIKDIVYIFEKLNDYADDTPKNELVQKLRIVLSAQISEKLVNSSGVIEVIEVSDKILASFAPCFDKDDDTGVLRIDASYPEKIAKKIKKKCAEFGITSPTLLVPIEFREMFFTLLENYLPDFNIVCHEEIWAKYPVEIIVTI